VTHRLLGGRTPFHDTGVFNNLDLRHHEGPEPVEVCRKGLSLSDRWERHAVNRLVARVVWQEQRACLLETRRPPGEGAKWGNV